MTALRYILRSLVFYRRTHLGVLLGALLAASVLTGSLSVGDSVRYSLRQAALARLGSTSVALVGGGHFFREQLAAEIAPLVQSDVAPVLMLRGTVALPDGSALAHDVQVVGVDERFWRIGGNPGLLANAELGACVVNDRLAERLGIRPGAALVLRVEEPSLLSRDAPLSGSADTSIAIRSSLKAVAGAGQFGRFSLQANQVPPLIVFLPLRELQKQVKQLGRANLLLVSQADVSQANAALRRVAKLADLNLEVRKLPETGGCELRTDRIFIEPGIASIARKVAPGASGVLTYLVNAISLGDRATPYSMVTATDAVPGVPQLGDDEIAINAWLAEDLGAKPGDRLALRYFVVAENRRLVEQTRQFKVRAVWSLERADASWMPSFPGLSNVENCRDWEPGMPMDMSKIRPKDEAYWKQFRGTPKAFLNLRAGQRIWTNRFGNLTAVRYAAGVEEIERTLAKALDPVQSGLTFQPVRENALKASAGAQDFGGLFIGFSFFLVIAALLLMAMLFGFSLEQRANETGLLLALGFDAKRVRRWLLAEGTLLAALGVGVGVCAGSLYTKLALHGLSTVWRDAVNFSAFHYHREPATLAAGAALSFGAALLAMALAVRGQARRPAAELLASGAETEQEMVAGDTRWSLVVGSVGVLGAGASLVLGGRSAEALFGAGAMLLIAGLAFTRAWLVKLSGIERTARGLLGIAIRGAARRRGRSLTTVAVLASGVFMVAAVGAFRADPLAHAAERSSGTGGFAFYGQTTLPVYEEVPEPGVVSLRVKAGDDASCLNLNRAQQPGFLGVRPAQLSARKAFTFIETLRGASYEAGWDLLDAAQADGATPAIGDEATVRWGLGKAVGETLDAIDEQGNPFRVRIVGVIANSVLQGNLVIAENHFVLRFPASGGSRAFLVDADAKAADGVERRLKTALQSRGLELVPAWRRLADFQAVESAYLRIFEALGGLGLLLGSAGLGIVVLRNIFERRNELALLQALGFTPRAVRWLVVAEHGFLIGLGVGIGGIAAAVAVLPSVLSPGVHASLAAPVLVLGSVALLGIGWSWVAACGALRGPLLEALRNE